MAKILNKFMEYIGFGKDDVEYDEEPEDGLRETETVPEERKKSTERRVLSTGNVVSLPGVNCGKMIVYRPVSYEDTQNIIDNLKGRKPVIVNMEQIEVETAHLTPLPGPVRTDAGSRRTNQPQDRLATMFEDKRKGYGLQKPNVK